MAVQSTRWSQGLSPRSRGNRASDLPDGGIHGSIPAQAGEPQQHRQRIERNGVYPRAGGGTETPAYSLTTSTGLSPRRRGNPRLYSTAICTQGSIPSLVQCYVSMNEGAESNAR